MASYNLTEVLKILKSNCPSRVKLVLCDLPRLIFLNGRIRQVSYYEMHCIEKYKLRSRNTGYCLIEVFAKADFTIPQSRMAYELFVSIHDNDLALLSCQSIYFDFY